MTAYKAQVKPVDDENVELWPWADAHVLELLMDTQGLNPPWFIIEMPLSAIWQYSRKRG